MRSARMNRRQFLKIAGATGAVAVPTVLGYRFVQAGQGVLPPSGSPYGPGAEISAVTDGSAPILVLINPASDNPFGGYYPEILLAEGLNAFQVRPLSGESVAELQQHPLVLLTEGALAQSQAESLEAYVAGGGRLVAMRPDRQLEALLGVERQGESAPEGYIRGQPGDEIGDAFSGGSLQIHSAAAHYRLDGARSLAWLADGSGELSDRPAVSLNAYGAGQAAMWAYDLACSVAYTRQGNPEWSGIERDGRPGIRAHDAFVDWVDLDRIGVPQADEQMRLLSRLIAEMLAGALPLPRLWYFPGPAESMLIATGDSHANTGRSIEDVLARVESYGGRMSVYYSPPFASPVRKTIRRLRWWASELPGVGGWIANPFSFPSPNMIADWRQRGHEFTLHPYVEEGLEEGWGRYWREFTGLGYGPVSPTVRTHRILWTGWTETAQTQASYGIRMNLDFYHHGPAFQKADGEFVHGLFTGSGLPMKFVDETGRILNIYQQLTPLVDEHLLGDLGGLAGLEVEEAVEVSETLMRRSLDGGYSALAAQFHVDPFFLGGPNAEISARWLEGTLQYAADNGIPIWTAEAWLGFTDARHEAVFERLEWDAEARRLTFRLESPQLPGDAELGLMMPLQHGGASLDRVLVDGAARPHGRRSLSGIEYGWVPVGGGAHSLAAIYA